MEPLGWGEPFGKHGWLQNPPKKWWFSEIYTIDSSINGGFFPDFFYHFTWIKWWFHVFLLNHFTNAGILKPYLMTGYGPRKWPLLG